MNLTDSELSTIFDVTEWKKLLKSISEIFRINIVMIDYKGNYFTDENTGEFCREIMTNGLGRTRCQKCDAMGGLEALRQNKPVFYRCHAGLTSGAVPIVVEDRYLGAICFGAILTEGETEEERQTGILGERSRLKDGENDELKAKLRRLYGKVPVVEKGYLLKIADVIWNLINYAVKQTVKLKNENSTYEWVLRNALTPFIDPQNVILNEAEEETLSSALPAGTGSQIYPALRYLEEHPEEAVSMRDMAKLCHLSHSYFSKLFLRSTGENFTDYVSRRKVERAKILLSESAESISSIAESLGFTDTSYFIKVFKKVENTTPLAFRQRRYLKK